MLNFRGTGNPAGTYKPEFMRTASGGWNTSIQGSPTQTGADVLNNCVGWVQGRALQIYLDVADCYDPPNGHLFDCFNCDPINFLNAAKQRGFEIVSNPVPGSILVTDSHVAIVEWKDSEGWLISESGYNYNGPAVLFQHSLYNAGGVWYSSFASDPLVKGFIKIPKVKDGLEWCMVWQLSENGRPLKGWQKIKGTWYFINEFYAMLTGWQKIGDAWYYMDDSGAMLTGWQKLTWKGVKNWYYLEPSGRMKTGWLKDSGKWYYLNASGAMVTGKQTINGKTYYFDNSGALIE